MQLSKWIWALKVQSCRHWTKFIKFYPEVWSYSTVALTRPLLLIELLYWFYFHDIVISQVSWQLNCHHLSAFGPLSIFGFLLDVNLQSGLYSSLTHFHIILLIDFAELMHTTGRLNFNRAAASRGRTGVGSQATGLQTSWARQVNSVDRLKGFVLFILGQTDCSHLQLFDQCVYNW